MDVRSIGFGNYLLRVLANYRYFYEVTIYLERGEGYYWSSTAHGSEACGLRFGGDAGRHYDDRANGHGIRCIKEYGGR